MKETESLDGTAPGGERRLRLFAILWGLASLAHLTNLGGQGFDHWWGWPTAAASIWLILRPGRTALLVFAAVQIVDAIAVSPLAADHQVLMAIVNLSILLSFLAGPRSAARKEDCGQMIAAIRVVVLVCYGAAALAKYNSTFLDPVTSCATFLAERATFGLITPDSSLSRAHVFATVAAESLVPILLIPRRTRRFGVLFAVVFHGLVSLSPAVAVEDFTLTLIALFTLFLPDGDVVRIHDAGRRLNAASSIARDLRRLSPQIRLLGFTAFLGLASQHLGLGWVLVHWILGLPIVAFMVIALARSLRKPGGVDPGTGVALVQIPAIALAMVVVFSPYIGLRTTGVFTMFSNLRTEGPGTNHVFMPSFHLTDHQNDLMTPTRASSDHFEEIFDAGHAIPFHELQVLVGSTEGVVFIGSRDGQPFDSRSEQVDAPDWFSARFLQFRSVPDSGPPICGN